MFASAPSGLTVRLLAASYDCDMLAEVVSRFRAFAGLSGVGFNWYQLVGAVRELAGKQVPSFRISALTKETSRELCSTTCAHARRELHAGVQLCLADSFFYAS